MHQSPAEHLSNIACGTILSSIRRVPIVQRPRTWPFQGQNTGSNPVGDVKDVLVKSFNNSAGVVVWAVQNRSASTTSVVVFGSPAWGSVESVSGPTSWRS